MSSKKKTATAVALCKQGKGLVKVNGRPLSLVEPAVLRFKVYEPILILGPDKFGRLKLHWMIFIILAFRKIQELTFILHAANVDIRVRVTGGGHVSQIYAIRQAISKSIVRSSPYDHMSVQSVRYNAYKEYRLHTTRNTLTSTQRTNSSKHLFSTTGHYSWRTTDGVNPRSSVVSEPGQDSKSRTVELWILWMLQCMSGRASLGSKMERFSRITSWNL